MDTSYVPTDMDYDKWKVRSAVFSELKYLEPTTHEQQRFVLGLRPFSPDKRQPELGYEFGEGVANEGKRGSVSRKKMGLKDQMEEAKRNLKLMMKDLQNSNDRAGLAEKLLADATSREVVFKADLEAYEVEVDELRKEREDLRSSKKEIEREFELLQEKFQAYMLVQDSKFPTREPSNLVFGKPKRRAPTREIREAHQEMVWFEQRHGKGKKKRKPTSSRKPKAGKSNQRTLGNSYSLPALT